MDGAADVEEEGPDEDADEEGPLDSVLSLIRFLFLNSLTKIEKLSAMVWTAALIFVTFSSISFNFSNFLWICWRSILLVKVNCNFSPGVEALAVASFDVSFESSAIEDNNMCMGSTDLKTGAGAGACAGAGAGKNAGAGCWPN